MKIGDVRRKQASTSTPSSRRTWATWSASWPARRSPAGSRWDKGAGFSDLLSYSPRELGERVVPIVERFAFGRSRHDNLALAGLGTTGQGAADQRHSPLRRRSYPLGMEEVDVSHLAPPAPGVEVGRAFVQGTGGPDLRGGGQARDHGPGGHCRLLRPARPGAVPGPRPDHRPGGFGLGRRRPDPEPVAAVPPGGGGRPRPRRAARDPGGTA